ASARSVFVWPLSRWGRQWEEKGGKGGRAKLEKARVTTPHGYSRGLLGRSQRLLTQSQHVLTGVEIPTEDQPTARTAIGTVGEGECAPMSTARALLRRVRGVHRDKPPASPCGLPSEEVAERGPRRVLDALGQKVGMHHPIDREVFDGNQVKT